MKYLKLFEGRNTGKFGNKEVCYKQKKSAQEDSYYIEMVHIPGPDGEESGTYIEYQVDKTTYEQTIVKCGTYKVDGFRVYYKYK